MDKFLNDKLTHKGMTLTDNWYVSEYDLPLTTVQNINDLIGKYTNILDLATTQIIDNRDFTIRFKEPEISNFIDNGGFKVYFLELDKQKEIDKEYKNNTINNAKPNKWYKKVEFWIPVSISLLAVIVPQLKTNEENNYMNKPEILEKVDSIYKASQSYSDSLFYLTNTSKETERDSL